MRPARSRPFAKHMCNVLYEDNHLLVVEKPPNLPVQADSSGDADLLTRAKAYIGKNTISPARFTWALCTGWTGPWAACWCLRAPPRRQRGSAQRLPGTEASKNATARWCAARPGRKRSLKAGLPAMKQPAMRA